ncbi:hypothetical protein DV737_g3128, partial [Chaetothyriales sp. CBS 132003]
MVVTCVTSTTHNGGKGANRAKWQSRRLCSALRAGYTPHAGRLSSLFSFSAPSTLFPPSAIISLTNDNSTFFLARPAAFGPALPAKGLSGQLWVGRGFGDEPALAGGALHTTGWDPLPDSNPAAPGKPGEPANAQPDQWQRPTHADIESLQESADIAGKIVLLARGGCGFHEKVKWVQRRGGIAVIVGEREKGGPLTNMYAKGDTSNVTIPAIFTTPVVNVPAKSPPPSAHNEPDWMQDALSAIGLADASLWHAEDSRRPPGSGNINSAPSKAKSTSTRRSEDDFVIGVQDWRDTELIAPKPTTTSSPHANDPKSRLPASLDSGPKKPAETALKGGSITPGSGEYEGGQESGAKPGAKNSGTDAPSAKHGGHDQDGARKGWFSFLLREKPSRKASDGPDEQDGLWVTLTPTSLSTSPLFDTLLVLVISPLITLTVVYALLLLRSRIRRRRWRAPKSVVERLPVRTYHTMSASSSTTSSQPSSPDHSHATSPTLQAVNHRSRPRSQTTTALLGCSPDSVLSLASSTPPTEKAGSKPRRAHFHGRQVECVVCLEEYVDGESRVMSLPCGHEFHADCITPWLVNRRRTCPICKRDVVRSMNRSAGPSHSTEHRLDRGDSAPDHVRGHHGALTVDDDASSALPIMPSRDDETDDDDIERGGDDVTVPLLGGQSLGQQSQWRNAVTRTFNRLGGDYAQRQTPHGIDRTR